MGQLEYLALEKVLLFKKSMFLINGQDEQKLRYVISFDYEGFGGENRWEKKQLFYME